MSAAKFAPAIVSVPTPNERRAVLRDASPEAQAAAHTRARRLGSVHDRIWRVHGCHSEEVVRSMSERQGSGATAQALRVVAFWLAALLIGASRADSLPLKADAVLVYKSERLLMLLRAGEVIAHFPISLGRHPVGPKTREGDARTPEGRYYIDWRNPDSRFYRSLHISYPNPNDLARAHSNGKPAGGDVMIHGMPNDPAMARISWDDWTDGCIAVANDAMDAIWSAVDDGTVIVIRP
jgi:murein L,D-transpeptidase YafK